MSGFKFIDALRRQCRLGRHFRKWPSVSVGGVRGFKGIQAHLLTPESEVSTHNRMGEAGLLTIFNNCTGEHLNFLTMALYGESTG